MAAWTSGELGDIAGTDEHRIASRRRNGRRDPVQPKVRRRQACRRGDHRAIGPVRCRGGLAAQDSDLVPQRQVLRVFRRVAAGTQYQPGEQAGHGEANEAEEHERRG